MVEDPANVTRYLAAVGEATEVPPRSPGRGPPYWKSRVLRRQALGDEDDALLAGHSQTAGRAAPAEGEDHVARRQLEAPGRTPSR
jgi:hypothetical protein